MAAVSSLNPSNPLNPHTSATISIPQADSTPRATSKMSPPRPALGSRQQSGSMIVPSNHPEIECKTPREFPPDDARAMSPRQSTENLAEMCGESRTKIQSSAIEQQAGLAALVEKIENVKSGHERLERDNNALQEYIGGLTRSMSKTDLTTGRKK